MKSVLAILVAVILIASGMHITIVRHGWLPLGAHNSVFVNFVFVSAIVSIILLALMSLVQHNVGTVFQFV